MDASGERAGAWDFVLMVATLVLLGGLGLQSLVGTLYVWWAQRADPLFMGDGYRLYVEVMNAIALPQVLALVAVMGLCVPKRLFRRGRLVAVSVALAVGGAVAGLAFADGVKGLAVYLALASLLQAAVVVFTVAGSPSLRSLHTGRVARVGSALLHMGLLVFGLVVLALRESGLLMPVFGISTLLILGGTALVFWPQAIATRD